MNINIAPYRKLVVALAAAFAILGTAASDGNLSTTELIEVALAFLGSAGVYQATNE